MKRSPKDLRLWLKLLRKTLDTVWTLRGTAEKLGVSYEVVRYYVLKYRLPYKYGSLTGWKFPSEDFNELMKRVWVVKKRKRGLYDRFKK